MDPLTRSYPELTPYQFASNRPIQGIDLDGLEFWNRVFIIGEYMKPVFEIVDSDMTDAEIYARTAMYLIKSDAKEIADETSLIYGDYRATADGLKNAWVLTTGEALTPTQEAALEYQAFMLHFGDFTPVADIEVLSTGQHPDGSIASKPDKVVAGVSVALPIIGEVAGPILKGVIKKLFLTEPGMQSVKKIANLTTDLKAAKNQDEFNKIFMGTEGPAKIIENPLDGKTYVIDGHHRLQAAEKANTGFSVPIQKVKLEDTPFDSFEEIIDASTNTEF